MTIRIDYRGWLLLGILAALALCVLYGSLPDPNIVLLGVAFWAGQIGLGLLVGWLVRQ